MKTFRRPVTAAAVALGLTAALVATPAIAADIYYPDVQLGTEDASSDRGYPAGIWFTGQSTTGTQTQTEDGLVVTDRTMLLFGADEIPILSGANFVELVQSISVDADGPWSLQLPVYLDNDLPFYFTTFRPAANNTTPGALDSEWITSWSLPGYDSNATLTLQEISDVFDEEIADEFNPALLAFGVLVDSGETTVRSITFNGDTHYFTPEPEVEEPPVVEPPVEEPPVVEPPVEDDVPAPEDDTAPPATPVEAEATFTG